MYDDAIKLITDVMGSEPTQPQVELALAYYYMQSTSMLNTHADALVTQVQQLLTQPPTYKELEQLMMDDNIQRPYYVRTCIWMALR